MDMAGCHSAIPTLESSKLSCSNGMTRTTFFFFMQQEGFLGPYWNFIAFKINTQCHQIQSRNKEDKEENHKNYTKASSHKSI
jgi:hypothetical protein